MALCLAESIVDTGGMDLADQLRRYVAWRRDGYLSSTGTCFDIGATTSRQLSRFDVNLGDDADTTAAIAGQLAGARWGASGIPPGWRSKLVLRSRIEELARSLFRAGGGAIERSWPHDDVIHGWWVDDDVLAGEFPAAKNDEVRSDEKLQILVDAGVRTFVDLTDAVATDGHLEPYGPRLASVAEARGLDLRRINHPIPDRSVVEDHVYDDILATIDESRSRGAVYVHCWGGVGRTGTVIGCLLAAAGFDDASIDDRIAQLRAGTSKAYRGCPENERQRAVIRRRAGR